MTPPLPVARLARLAALLLGLALLASLPAAPSAAAATVPALQLLASTSTDRSGAGPLDGTVRPAPVSVWLSAPAGSVRSVLFSVDNLAVRTTTAAPFDLGGSLAGGGSAAYAFTPGAHVLRADVTTATGTSSVQAGFVVTATYSLLAVDLGSKAGATPLDGSLRGKAVHALVPDTGTIRSVAFSVDGAPAVTDSAAPYDLAGSGPGSGPFTFPLSAGSHVLRAVVTPRSGPAVTLTAHFRTGRTVPVSTTAQLRTALATAVAGDVITLADGTYVSSPQFEAAADGTAQQPIVLTGSRAAILSSQRVTGGGYGLHVTGDWWVVRGVSVRASLKGVVLDGAQHATLESVEVSGTGQEAIRFRTSSADGVVRGSYVHDTGVYSPEYGEGIYVGSAARYWPTYGSNGGPDRSDHVLILDTVLAGVTAEAVDTKEGTTGGAIVGTTFAGQVSGEHYADSWVDVKANDRLVELNSGSIDTAGQLVDAFQVHPNSGWGQRAVFRRNAVSGSLPGYGMHVFSGATATVGCDNSAPQAVKGLSNLACG